VPGGRLRRAYHVGGADRGVCCRKAATQGGGLSAFEHSILRRCETNQPRRTGATTCLRSCRQRRLRKRTSAAGLRRKRRMWTGPTRRPRLPVPRPTLPSSALPTWRRGIGAFATIWTERRPPLAGVDRAHKLLVDAYRELSARTTLFDTSSEEVGLQFLGWLQKELELLLVIVIGLMSFTSLIAYEGDANALSREGCRHFEVFDRSNEASTVGSSKLKTRC
jgi:hypothetical protein